MFSKVEWDKVCLHSASKSHNRCHVRVAFLRILTGNRVCKSVVCHEKSLPRKYQRMEAGPHRQISANLTRSSRSPTNSSKISARMSKESGVAAAAWKVKKDMVRAAHGAGQAVGEIPSINVEISEQWQQSRTRTQISNTWSR